MSGEQIKELLVSCNDTNTAVHQILHICQAMADAQKALLAEVQDVHGKGKKHGGKGQKDRGTGQKDGGPGQTYGGKGQKYGKGKGQKDACGKSKGR